MGLCGVRPVGFWVVLDGVEDVWLDGGRMGSGVSRPMLLPSVSEQKRRPFGA